MTDPTPIAIVGEDHEDDYIIQPQQHADLYRGPAPGLAAILEHSKVSVVAKNFARHDADAKAAQSEYQTAANRSNWAVLLAALLGGLSMSLQIVLGKDANAAWPAAVVSLATAAVGAVGGYWVYTIRQNQLLENWMTSRARAETARIDLFSQIGDAAGDPANAASLELLLEYFRRYQLDVQIAYYRSRRKEHIKSARRTTAIGAAGTVIAGLAATGLAGGVFSASGIFGVAGAALIAFSVAREQLTQDRRNAERYGRTTEALMQIEKKLSDVRTAAANRQSQPVIELIAAVNDQCSLEHRQWLESGEGAAQGLARLDAALKATGGPETAAKK